MKKIYNINGGIQLNEEQYYRLQKLQLVRELDEDERFELEMELLCGEQEDPELLDMLELSPKQLVKRIKELQPNYPG